MVRIRTKLTYEELDPEARERARLRTKRARERKSNRKREEAQHPTMMNGQLSKTITRWETKNIKHLLDPSKFEYAVQGGVGTRAARDYVKYKLDRQYLWYCFQCKLPQGSNSVYARKENYINYFLCDRCHEKLEKAGWGPGYVPRMTGQNEPPVSDIPARVTRSAARKMNVELVALPEDEADDDGASATTHKKAPTPTQTTPTPTPTPTPAPRPHTNGTVENNHKNNDHNNNKNNSTQNNNSNNNNNKSNHSENNKKKGKQPPSVASKGEGGSEGEGEDVGESVRQATRTHTRAHPVPMLRYGRGFLRFQ